MRASLLVLCLVGCSGKDSANESPGELDGDFGFEVQTALAVMCPPDLQGREYMVVTAEGSESTEGCDMDGASFIPMTCERRVAYVQSSQVCEGAPSVPGENLPMLDQYLLKDAATGAWQSIDYAQLIVCEDGFERTVELFGPTDVTETDDGDLVLDLNMGETEDRTGALSGEVRVTVCPQ